MSTAENIIKTQNEFNDLISNFKDKLPTKEELKPGLTDIVNRFNIQEGQGQKSRQKRKIKKSRKKNSNDGKSPKRR